MSHIVEDMYPFNVVVYDDDIIFEVVKPTNLSDISAYL